MKSKRFLFLLFFAIFVIGISCYIFSNDKKKNQSFVRIPVRFFPFKNEPRINVEIQGKKYHLLVDLGLSDPFKFQTKYINKIKNKEPIPNAKSIGIRGNIYSNPGFKVPKINIERNLKIFDAPIFEQSSEFLQNAKIWPNLSFWSRCVNKVKQTFIHGNIGLGLFKQMACFFDLPNAEIVIAENISTLTKDACCSLEGFIRVPFSLESDGLMFFFETDIGIKKFLLDSGATFSFLKDSLVEKKEAVEVEPGKWLYVTNQFSNADHNFGKWPFYLINFSDFFDFHGILGIDFFKKHQIYLDFHNQIAYIRPYRTPGEKFMALVQNARSKNI